VVEASAEALSVAVDFFEDVDFLVVPESAAAVSVESAAFLDLDDFFVVEASAASVDESAFLEVLDFFVDASADESSVVFFFFLDLEVVVELLSDWSVDCEDCGFEAARTETLPARSSNAATRARKTGLRAAFILRVPFARGSSAPSRHVG